MPHSILTKMARNRAKLQEAISSLSEAALDQAAADGWTIRQMLTHLLNAEEDNTAVIGVFLRGDLDKLPTELDLNTHNQGRVNERGHLERADLFAALEAQRARTIELINGLTAEQLELSGPHPILGDSTVEQILRIIAIHDQLHLRDINAILSAAAPEA